MKFKILVQQILLEQIMYFSNNLRSFAISLHQSTYSHQ